MSEGDVLERSAEAPDLVLRYADHADGVIDVYLPVRRTPGASPLVVAVHGGFWRQAYDRTHLRPLAVALVRKGFAVALPEYRRVGGHGGWPATGDDVEAALAYIPAAIATAADGVVDADARVVLTGHSAGGHLALWSGLRAPHRVAAIVALAPVSDVRYAANHDVGAGAVQALLGGGPNDVPDRYVQADVLRLLRSDVPVTVVHGTADDAVPVEMSRRLARRFAAGDHAGPGLVYRELAGCDHFALIDPLTPAFRAAVLPALLSAVPDVSARSDGNP